MAAPLSSIIKALKVLETFSRNEPERGVTEISEILKIHKSSISRIIGTLAFGGYLEKNPLTGRYRLGFKLVDLGNRVLGHYDLRDHAIPFMVDLAKRTNEIIHLSILDKGEIIYLEKRGEGQILTVATKIGGRSPAHACGMGKVLLSGLPPEELAKFLASASLSKLTPKTISEVPKLQRELDRIRKFGFAIDDEESFLGIRCVAAPIRGSQGRIEAALSITAPKQRMGQERMEELKKEVIETARAISKRVEIGMSGST